jgi:Transposase DDE domain
MPRGQQERGVCQGTGSGDWGRMLERLAPGWEGRAREHEAFVRRREVKSAGDLLRLVLSAAVQGWSRPLVASWAALLGMGHLSGEAVGKRVRQARAWLGAEVGLLLRLRREVWAGRSVRVRLVDATTIREPGGGGTEWRAHALVDLQVGALCGLELTDRHGAESLLRQPIEPGEIAVADRAHGRRTDFGQLLARGTDLVVRIGWQNLPLETPEGDRLALADWLEAAVTAPTERAVLVETPTGTHPLRLLAVPLPPAQAAEARRRLRRAAAKKQRTPDRRTSIAAGFVMLVTTLDPRSWSLADVLALYRCRWQIELFFKRLKSVWHLDRLRARDPDAAQAHLLGVILAALLAGQLSATAPIPLDAWLDDPHRPLSRWRWETLWHDAILHAIRGHVTLLSLHRRLLALRRHLCTSPRRRPLQAVAARSLLRSHDPHQEPCCA